MTTPPPTHDAKLLRLVRGLPVRGVPIWARYSIIAGVVLLALLLRFALDQFLGPFPFLLAYPAIMLASLLFDRGSGVFAVLLTTVLWLVFFVRPEDGRHWVGVGVFVFTGLCMALALEVLHLATAALARRESQVSAAAAKARQEEQRKDLLLRELGHRVRNDLTAVTTLLRQRARRAAANPEEALREAADQVAVLSRVHARLEANGGDLKVEARPFLDDLVTDLDLARAAGSRVAVTLTRCDNFQLSTTAAAAVGLIVNELVTNSIKYAFVDGRSGSVHVSLTRRAERAELIVEDDGIGTAPGEPPAQGLGTRLVGRLADQIHGAFTREFRPGQGTLCRLSFPAPSAGE